MNIKKSELRIEKFNLLGLNIISFPENDEENTRVETNSNFDFDFDVFFSSDDESLFKIIVRMDNYNQNQTNQGYGIDVFGEFKFRFDKKRKLSEDQKNNFVGRSALPMAIAHLRSIVAITTSNFHLGSYFIPSIDMNHLLQKKIETMDVETDSSEE
jgi:hypothetical protein